jgi:hypothetical protein
MDTDSTNTEATPREAAAPAKPGRPPPIVLTFAVNLIQLQTQLKGVVIENFEFRSTRNGTRVVTRSMADFQSVKSHFDGQNLSYYSFLKSEKSIKAVIRHLPLNNPAEDISNGMMSLSFEVVSVKQMTATRRSPPEESKIINLPLFLVTLPRTAKSQEIFVCLASATLLSGWRLIEPTVLLPSATNASSSATSGQTASSLPAAYGEEAVTYTRSAPRKEIHLPPQHAATVGWRKEKSHIPQIIGVSDAKQEIQKKKKSQRAPRTTTGRVFSSNLTTPGMSFAAALRSKTEEQQQPRTHQVAVPDTVEQRVPAALPQHEQQKAGQSVRAQNIKSLSLDKMF